MNKEELKDELKNRISMALKDPVLQQGFEIICKENAELQHKVDTLQGFLDHDIEYDMDKAIQSLKKENAKLKADYGVLSCSVGDFGELQDKLEEEQRKNNGLSDNLTKATEIIREIMKYEIPTLDYEKAEQFLKEIEK